MPECQLGACSEAARAALAEDGTPVRMEFIEGGTFRGGLRTRAVALHLSDIGTFVLREQCTSTVFASPRGAPLAHRMSVCTFARAELTLSLHDDRLRRARVPRSMETDNAEYHPR